MNFSKNKLLLAFCSTLVAFDVVKHKHNEKEEKIQPKNKARRKTSGLAFFVRMLFYQILTRKLSGRHIASPFFTSKVL